MGTGGIRHFVKGLQPLRRLLVSVGAPRSLKNYQYDEIMNDVLLTIRGLTHSEISGEREAFLQSALGCRIWLQPASQLLDEMRVEAFVGTKQVGCVASEDLSLFWQAMDAVKSSSGGNMLQGEIVKVEDYMILARIRVPLLEKPRIEAVELTNWEYNGPLMYKSKEEVKLEYLTARLSEDISTMEQDEVLELLDAFCQLIVYDLSREAQAFRKSLRKRLEECESEELRQASRHIEELSRRIGGNTMMEKMGQWLKNELTESDAALMMPARKYEFSRIVAEAKKLPKNMFELWHRDTAQMARVLYGLRATRDDVRRVLSCLVWIELREREHGIRYGSQKDWLNIDEMVMYCKLCVSWEDARPIVEMMRNHLTQSGYQTGEELEKINSIESEFLSRSKPLPTHKEIVLQKHVGTEIQNVAAGGTGVNNNIKKD